MGLKEIREQRGHTRREIANFLGVTEQTVINIEKGSNTHRDNVLRLADFYGVSTDYILGREPAEPEGSAQ